ncbi:MAG: hypothetical protein R3A52_25715 [Polyangiales bacterium]
MRATSGAMVVGGVVGDPPQVAASKAEASTRYAPEAQPVLLP